MIFLFLTLPPPTSTLFPYTTLFRSLSRRRGKRERARRRAGRRDGLRVARRRDRSEEHTSELQSLTNIVCRLLLEKKKNERGCVGPRTDEAWQRTERRRTAEAANKQS